MLTENREASSSLNATARRTWMSMTKNKVHENFEERTITKGINYGMVGWVMRKRLGWYRHNRRMPQMYVKYFY